MICVGFVHTSTHTAWSSKMLAAHMKGGVVVMSNVQLHEHIAEAVVWGGGIAMGSEEKVMPA